MYPENDFRNYLEHSAKGTHWKKGHKYIAIKNGKYIYPEDLKSGRSGLYSAQSRKFDLNDNSSVTRSGGGSNSVEVKPKNLKARPGGTSATDEIKQEGPTFANRPRGHKRKTVFTKNSKSKKWNAQTATVKKGKKLNLHTKVGNVLNRPFH